MRLVIIRVFNMSFHMSNKILRKDEINILNFLLKSSWQGNDQSIKRYLQERKTKTLLLSCTYIPIVLRKVSIRPSD